MVTLKLDAPMSLYFEFQRFTDPDADARGILEKFARELLIEWNLEDDNGPVPATPEAFIEQPLALASALLQKWTEVAVEVPAPLDEPSPNGAQSAAPLNLALG